MCEAGFGGAIYAFETQKSVYVSKCKISSCCVSATGGGFSVTTFDVSSNRGENFGYDNVLFSSLSFSNCSSGFGGSGLYFLNPSKPFYVTDCQWVSCKQTSSSSESHGGAGIMFAGSHIVQNLVVFNYTYFYENVAAKSDGGHDIYLSGPLNSSAPDGSNTASTVWWTTSPFEISTCRSQTGSGRTFPTSLAGYENCDWLPAGAQVTRQSLSVSNTSGAAIQTVTVRTGIVSVVFEGEGSTKNLEIEGSLPKGVSSSTQGKTLTIRGTPSERGKFSYTVWASDGVDTVAKKGTITVKAADPADPQAKDASHRNSVVILSAATVTSVLVTALVVVGILVQSRRRRQLRMQPSMEQQQVRLTAMPTYQTFDE
jgi:hypothetical protein